MSRVLCVCSDLIFATRIRGAARDLGVPLLLCKDRQGLSQALQEPAAMLIIDLDATGGDDPLALIQEVRARPDRPRVLAYVAHVRKELAAAAREAGADEVLPRSRFSARLHEVLRGEFGDSGLSEPADPR